jgi:hypothetical protein
MAEDLICATREGFTRCCGLGDEAPTRVGTAGFGYLAK